jgi:hypothetical protein
MARSSARRSSGRQGRRKKQNNNNLWLLIGGGVVVVIIILAATLSVRSNSQKIGEQTEPSSPPPSQHIANVTDPHPPYVTNPPTYGYHHVSAASAGIYTEPLPDEITVHNLEHGFVIIHYRQDAAPETVTQLTNITRELQQLNPCVILQPRAVDNLDVPLALTAWNWMLKLDTVDAEQIRTFFRGHVGNGPEPVCRPL